MMDEQKIADVGNIKVHNNAIKSITELTAAKIKGIVRINRGPINKILSSMGIDKSVNILDGIRVDSSQAGTKISLDIVAEYGHDISEIATKVQDDIKQAVENMTGISSVEVDVNVSGVESGGGEK